ncbi:unnamed protein product, partial [marine sediment metagenome]
DEDSKADVDFNLIMNENSEIIEIQGTAEGATFNRSQLNDILQLGEEGILQLIKMQKSVLNL